MAPSIGYLQTKVSAKLRTSDNLAPVNVQLRCDEAARALQIELPYGPEDDRKMAPPEIRIKFQDMSVVKAREYLDELGSLYVLTVVLQEGCQYSVQFESQDLRDRWHVGLRTVVSNRFIIGGGAAKVANAGFASIVKIGIHDVGPPHVVSIKVDLSNDSQVFFAVPPDATDHHALKAAAHEFIDKHGIFPHEKTSFFRFARAVVARILMADETTAIIDEINAQHLPELLKGSAGRGALKEAMACAEDSLCEIEKELPNRIGEQGAGSHLVTQILRRNIARMRAVNEIIARRMAEEATPRPGV